jgi:hypothetical protein
LIPSGLICKEDATPATASKDKVAQGANIVLLQGKTRWLVWANLVETTIPRAVTVNELVVKNEDAMADDRS